DRGPSLPAARHAGAAQVRGPVPDRLVRRRGQRNHLRQRRRRHHGVVAGGDLRVHARRRQLRRGLRPVQVLAVAGGERGSRRGPRRRARPRRARRGLRRRELDRRRVGGPARPPPALRMPETLADLSLAYDVSWMRNLSPPPVIDPNIPVPSRPETGVNTGFSLRWLLSDVRAFTFTLGPVQGRNVAFGLRLENPAI